MRPSKETDTTPRAVFDEISIENKVQTLSEESIQVTLALYYIEKTFSDVDKCKSGHPVTLENYKLNLQDKEILKQFKHLADKAVVIANSLTDILERNVIKHTLNDSHIKTLYSVWKYTVHNNSQIAGGGIAFSDFFPYVSKDSSDRVSPFENLKGEFNYTEAEFYSALALRNFSYLWRAGVFRTGVVATDGYWTVPYYDCNNTEKWIITYSVPFFQPSKSRFPEFR